MADEIASAMEQEMVEEQAIKCPRPSAKRQRKGSPDAREETDKGRVDDSLLQDARRIKENIRVYMNATDRNVSAKVQKHVNGKMQQLIDIMETIYDKNYEKTFLVQRVVKDTLASSEMYDIIVNALVEKAVPMVIEGLKSESKTIQRPLSEPQTSREFPCVKEQPLLADAHAIIETTENESFQERNTTALKEISPLLTCVHTLNTADVLLRKEDTLKPSLNMRLSVKLCLDLAQFLETVLGKRH
ncbi:unnamed protein product [Nezara viridula]|uniref:Uncharacterized protein n=1 Tax=Nezara viridula TaxID=85310 RepID=A0A9P0H7Q3_NEZVI|nr:unnamed protein product [Nezara viridula]